MSHIIKKSSLLACFLLSALTAQAQITTNNALPVGKGRGIVRIQQKMIRATNDPTAANREMLAQVYPLVGVYGITSRFSVFGIFPFLDKSLALTIPSQQRIKRGSGTGLGDVRFFGRYDVYRVMAVGRILSISAFGGLQIPTGRYDKTDSFGLLPQSLQTGTGAWDPFAGVVLTWQTLRWFLDAATSYQINTQANHFEFGDEYELDGVVKYRLLPQRLGPDVPGYFYLDLESNLIRDGKNKMNGVTNENSGGTTWYADPGLQFVTQKFVFEAAIQLPVVQNLNGAALKKNFITTLSIRMNI